MFNVAMRLGRRVADHRARIILRIAPLLPHVSASVRVFTAWTRLTHFRALFIEFCNLASHIKIFHETRFGTLLWTANHGDRSIGATGIISILGLTPSNTA
jgi:hypothetical protein